MMSPNTECKILFYNSNSLKEIMKRKCVTGSGSTNTKWMNKAVAGTSFTGIEDDFTSTELPLDNLSNQDATIKEILENIFLPH